ncbi:translation elongation factor 4 [Candidatus Riflebacteria bacterium]
MKNIRNFCIIAHIDHGKSTLADRLIEFTQTVRKREMRDQILDTMDLERERGITIKAQSVCLKYKANDGEEYICNLIDTPGHVDFTYEVNRALASCEGAVLVVDAAQGIEAQTLANVYMAIENDLEIITVINKIDLPAAAPERVAREVEEVIGLSSAEAIFASAKNGTGIDTLLESIVKRVSQPKGQADGPLRALIYDARFDPFKGVIAYIRVFDGQLKARQKIRLFSTGEVFEVTELGIFVPDPKPVNVLDAGMVGYFAASIKEMGIINIGDTVTDYKIPAIEPLPGYRKVKPMVFSGLYPVDSDHTESLRKALEKLNLNDSSFTCTPESSNALGFGFRCGFLGLLHMEIIQERIEREYGLALIFTAPNVVYQVTNTDGKMFYCENPVELPEPGKINKIEEPFVCLTIFVPKSYVGTVMQLVQDRRGKNTEMEYFSLDRVNLKFELPFHEIILDFNDTLKSCTKGYASLDYEHIGFRESKIVRVDILVNQEKVDALSFLSHRSRAERRGRYLVERLRKLIPRQQFQVPIQAAIGGKIIARENISALRKNVLAKCYGGDITRKRKLLEKQKEGKKRMKMVGSVNIPQEAFLAVLDNS